MTKRSLLFTGWRKKYTLEQVLGLYERFLKPVVKEDMYEYITLEIERSRKQYDMDIQLTDEHMKRLCDEVEWLREILDN